MNMIEILNAYNTRICEINEALPKINDELAIEIPHLFPSWETNIDYTIDFRVRYGEKLYKCVQAHTSQQDWTPDVTPALWTEVAEPGEIPVWKQPTGAQDTYNKGDKVHYPDEQGPVYVSTVDANTWPPNVYGWELM